MSRGAAITPPTLFDTLQTFKLDLMASLNCVKVGEIVSFDGEKKTADIRILFKKILPSGGNRSHPVLTNCPVFTLQGGGAALQLPIAPGDQCLVLFSDRNLDAWFKSGREEIPFDGRTHDLSDGIALVGLNSLASSLEDYEPDVARLFSGEAEVRLEHGNVSIAGGEVAIVGGSEIHLNEKIVLQNATTDLLTLITGLFTALSALKTTSNLTLHADSLTALQTVKTQFEALLGPAV